MKKLLILTVCYGNIHRSVVAEQSLRQALQINGLSDEVIVTSRGLQGFHEEPPPEGRNIGDYLEQWLSVQPVAMELGLDLCNHHWRSLDHDVVSQASLILAMDVGVMSERESSILKVFPEYEHKVKLFGELAGEKTSIIDVFENQTVSIADTTRLIHEIAHRNIHQAMEWVRLFSNYKKGEEI